MRRFGAEARRGVGIAQALRGDGMTNRLPTVIAGSGPFDPFDGSTDPLNEAARPGSDAPPAPETGGSCIWISAESRPRLEPVGRAVQRLLLSRRVPTDLVSGSSVESRNASEGAPKIGALVEFLADAAASMTSVDRTVVVAGPVLDSADVCTVRERIRRLVHVSVDSAALEGRPPPIPTIYWYVRDSLLLEAAIPPQLVECADRADIVVSGAVRSPEQLAGEIVDALVRTGWLTVPRADVIERAGPTRGVGRRARTAGPRLTVPAYR